MAEALRHLRTCVALAASLAWPSALAQEGGDSRQQPQAPLGEILLPPDEGITVAAGGSGDWRFVPPERSHSGGRVIRYEELSRTRIRVEAIAPSQGAEAATNRETLGEIELFDDGVSFYATWLPATKQTDASGAPAFMLRENHTGLSARVRLGAPAVAPASKQIAGESIVFLLDASGSMNGERLQRAKEALFGALESVSRSVEFAVVVLFDCDEIETLERFTSSPAALRAAVQPIQAKGGTPLGDALGQAFEYLHHNSRNTPSRRRIILLSDGQSTCGQSPLEVVAGWDPTLREQQSVQVIGLEVTGADRAGLEAIAKAARGVFMEADKQTVREQLKRAVPMRNDR